MPISDDIKKKLSSTHSDASGCLRKVIASRGQRQGNFYVVCGNSTVGMALTLSHRDKTGQKAKSEGKKVRTVLKKVEATKFAQGVVGLDSKNKLVFTMLAGNASPTLIKKAFKKTALWGELGFDKPELLKRAKVQLTKTTPDGEQVTEAAESDSDETALSEEEIKEAGRLRFGDLPDFRALWEDAADIEKANQAVLSAMADLDDEDLAEKVFDEIELAVLEGGSLSEQLAEQYPDVDFSDAQLAAVERAAEAATGPTPDALDLKALRFWLTEYTAASAERLIQEDAWDKRQEQIETLKDAGTYAPSGADQAQVLTLHFVRRRRARAILGGLKVLDALGRVVFPEVIAVTGASHTGREWKSLLMQADAETFVDDPDRLWDPVTIAEAEKEVLSFPEDAPLGLDEWEAPEDGEGRTRCPFLNLSANHGWIPRSGWVTYTQLRRVLIDRGSITATVADLLCKAVFDRIKVTGPDGTEMVNLADLRHAGIFHPGGLGHKDEDATASDEEIVELLAEISADGTYLTEEDVKVAMKARHEESGSVTLENMPFAFGEAFFLFNALAREVEGFDEPVIHVDDLRTFLGKNQFPPRLMSKSTDESSGLVETVVSIVDVGVDSYLPVFNSRVNERVLRVLAERKLRAHLKAQGDAVSGRKALVGVLKETEFYSELDSVDEKKAAFGAIMEHLVLVGVAEKVSGGWTAGDKLRPPVEDEVLNQGVM